MSANNANNAANATPTTPATPATPALPIPALLIATPAVTPAPVAPAAIAAVATPAVAAIGGNAAALAVAQSKSKQVLEKPARKKSAKTVIVQESPFLLLQQLSLDFARMFKEAILCDVTLLVGKQRVPFKAHRALLASRCEYFYSLFHANMADSNSPTLEFPDKNPEDFKVLLDFFYTSQIKINHENAFGVLKMADEYNIKVVKERCIAFVRKYINEENVFDVLEEARFHTFLELISYCKRYLEKNARQMFSSASFLTISKETLIDLLTSDKIHLSELEIFFSVLEWGKHRILHREEYDEEDRLIESNNNNNSSSLVAEGDLLLATKKNNASSVKRKKRRNSSVILCRQAPSSIQKKFIQEQVKNQQVSQQKQPAPANSNNSNNSNSSNNNLQGNNKPAIASKSVAAAASVPFSTPLLVPSAQQQGASAAAASLSSSLLLISADDSLLDPSSPISAGSNIQAVPRLSISELSEPPQLFDATETEHTFSEADDHAEFDENYDKDNDTDEDITEEEDEEEEEEENFYYNQVYNKNKAAENAKHAADAEKLKKMKELIKQQIALTNALINGNIGSVDSSNSSSSGINSSSGIHIIINNSSNGGLQHNGNNSGGANSNNSHSNNSAGNHHHSNGLPPEQLKDRLSKICETYLQDKKFVKQLKALLADILPLVRFPLLTPHELYDYVEPTRVVAKELLLEAYRTHALVNRVDIYESNQRLRVREGSLFFMPGILENVPLKFLRGWTCCYRKPYADKTTEAVFDLVLGNRILVAARHKNSPNLALCAMGRKSRVLKETFENETTKDNGVYWYHWKNHSVGFSNTSSINLGSADLAPGTHKLSWHLTGRGGYRCGEIKNLNESEEWEKLIFYA